MGDNQQFSAYIGQMVENMTDECREDFLNRIVGKHFFLGEEPVGVIESVDKRTLIMRGYLFPWVDLAHSLSTSIATIK